MQDLKKLEDDMAKVTDKLRQGLTNSFQSFDINIKLNYDESAKEVKVIQNGMVIKTVDYSDEKHSARADQELTSYMQKLKNEFYGM